MKLSRRQNLTTLCEKSNLEGCPKKDSEKLGFPGAPDPQNYALASAGLTFSFFGFFEKAWTSKAAGTIKTIRNRPQANPTSIQKTIRKTMSPNIRICAPQAPNTDPKKHLGIEEKSSWTHLEHFQLPWLHVYHPNDNFGLSLELKLNILIFQIA